MIRVAEFGYYTEYNGFAYPIYKPNTVKYYLSDIIYKSMSDGMLDIKFVKVKTYPVVILKPG